MGLKSSLEKLYKLKHRGGKSTKNINPLKILKD